MRSGLVSYRWKAALAVASLLFLYVSHTSACSLAEGYFYQITALKGRVVGISNPHGMYVPGWFRQSFARKHAKLALYEYHQPWDQSSIVKTIETDNAGYFDFGPLKTGHYTLRIDDNDLFAIEVKELPRITVSVIIDVSPIHPDCTGGHEFIVKTK